MNWLEKHWRGLVLTAGITYIAYLLSLNQLAQQSGFSSLTLAIVLGMLIGNTLYAKIAKPCSAGVDFSKARLLRLGIILYGFRLTFQQVLDVGVGALLIDLLIVCLTFMLGSWLGRKVFKLHPHTALLIASGASICGAAAVLATAPVLKSRSSSISVAVATVVIFGTISIFLYPLFYHLLADMNIVIAQKQFGIYIGSTVHEVAQVVAAGNAVGSQATDSAVITKMVRVMMLAPFLLWLSYALARRNPQKHQGGKIIIPWFAVGFVAMVAFNSLNLLPKTLVDSINQIDTILLTMAMAALGLTTHFSAIKQAGVKPLLLALLIFIWLVVGGAGLNYLFA
ncbi:MAG: YeiH family protein [Pasteurellaceae bacterium]|nr:YeiH family protein [Pasteurellaceae bacterium]